MLHIDRKSWVISFLILILTSAIAPLSFSLTSPIMIPSSGSINCPPTEGPVVFEDDFESGDSNAWTGVATTTGDAATIIAANPYDGDYHGRLQTGSIASGVKYAYFYKTLSPAQSELFARAYFHIVDGLPLNDDGDRFGLIGFEVEDQLTATFRVYRSGGVDMFNIVGLNGADAVQKSADAVYPVEGQWYCLEFYIKVHNSMGEYRAWINGVESIAITNLNTARYGVGVNKVRFGLTYTANVQHYAEVYVDSAVISTSYIGQLRYNFGVIGPVGEVPAIRNFYYLFGNQNIRYRALMPSEITDFADVDCFDALVIWTKPGYTYNTAAIREFAKERLVISHVWDFCEILFPILSGSTQVVTTRTVTYVKEWGNFRTNDLVEMRNETGNTDRLTTVMASSLASFSNVTTIARYDADRIAFLHMSGARPESGFYVMDLDATTPTTEWAGIWHLFPAIKMIKDFPTGRYARWFANGIEHWTYDQVMARLGSWVANAPKGMNASLIRIGKSVLGRDINATRFGNGSRYMIIDGAMHGNEKNPVPALLRLLEVIQENFEANGYWKNRLKEVSLIIIPILNPDGYVSFGRYNANGVDLNRQFPPGKTTTEPEAWALRWLWGNYSTITYINLHTGRNWQPLDYFYAVQFTTTPIDIEQFSRQNIYWTGGDFEALSHWGYYTEEGWNLPIGRVRLYSAHSGTGGQTDIGASYLYNISSYLVESFVWNSDHKARQILWAMDYYISTVLGFITHLDRLRSDDFLVVTQGNIKSFTWTGTLQLEIDTSQLAHSANSITKIDLANRAKPLFVFVDNEEKSEGDAWTYSDGIITITGAKNRIEIRW